MYLNTNNPLLVKDDVGRAKPPVRELPGNQFTYGYKPPAALEGVKEGMLISIASANSSSTVKHPRGSKGLCTNK